MEAREEITRDVKEPKYYRADSCERGSSVELICWTPSYGGGGKGKGKGRRD